MKKFFCDRCGKEVVYLFDLCTQDDGIKSVCEKCYYETKLDEVCMATLADCESCLKC
jgi:NMD protein affecting ribosome stability and mRNA decay